MAWRGWLASGGYGWRRYGWGGYWNSGWAYTGWGGCDWGWGDCGWGPGVAYVGDYPYAYPAASSCWVHRRVWTAHGRYLGRRLVNVCM